MKITKRQLKRIIREEYSRLKRRGLIKEAWSSQPGGPNDLKARAKMLGLERSDALLGAAMELEARDPELSYVGRRGRMGADVYLRYDNTYTVEAYGERYDGLDSEELLDLLEQI